MVCLTLLQDPASPPASPAVQASHEVAPYGFWKWGAMGSPSSAPITAAQRSMVEPRAQ